MKKLLVFAILFMMMAGGKIYADGNDYWLLEQFAASGGVILKAVVSETGVVYIHNNTLGMSVTNASAGVYNLRWKHTLLEPTIIAVADDTTGVVTCVIANKNTTGCSVYVFVASPTSKIEKATITETGALWYSTGGFSSSALPATGVTNVRWATTNAIPNVQVTPETTAGITLGLANVSTTGCSVYAYSVPKSYDVIQTRVTKEGTATQTSGGITATRQSTGIYNLFSTALTDTPAVSVLCETTGVMSAMVANGTTSSCSVYIYNETLNQNLIKVEVDINGNVTRSIGGCTCILTSAGVYEMRWTATSEVPVVVCTPETTMPVFISVASRSTTGCTVYTYSEPIGTGAGADTPVVAGCGFNLVAYAGSILTPTLTDIDFSVMAKRGANPVPVLGNTKFDITLQDGAVEAPILRNCGFNIIGFASQ